jgi:polysaccharide export outer membrane protein
MHLSRLLLLAVSLLAMAVPGLASAQATRPYLLGAGDLIRITVFQNPDMTTETRVADNGSITFPLIGAVEVGGQTTGQAEQRIANALKSGGFVLRPQVNVVVTQFRSRQISVLGYVNRPGRYPMEDQVLRLADALALAGGVGQLGGETVILTRTRGGKDERMVIDMDAAFVFDDLARNVEIQPGDTIYVPRYPMFYIYGQVSRPGQYRLERNMTVSQALALGGGPTLRGTEKGITIRRRDVGGKVDTLNAGLQDRVMQDDVVYIKESVF